MVLAPLVVRGLAPRVQIFLNLSSKHMQRLAALSLAKGGGQGNPTVEAHTAIGGIVLSQGRWSGQPDHGKEYEDNADHGVNLVRATRPCQGV